MNYQWSINAYRQPGLMRLWIQFYRRAGFSRMAVVKIIWGNRANWCPLFQPPNVKPCEY